VTARVLHRQPPRGGGVTGRCPVCECSLMLTAARSVFAHGPSDRPRCPGGGLRVQPDWYPTPLAAIRAAETRLHLPEWQRLPLQPHEETP
jgi:hypothetical protein